SRRAAAAALFSVLMALGLAACGDTTGEAEERTAEPVSADADSPSSAVPTGPDASGDSAGGSGDDAVAQDRVVPVVTTEYAIEMPDRLETGWTTFDFHNAGDQVHFVILYRLAEGHDIEDQREHVVPAFDALMEGLRSGEMTKADIGPFLVEEIPEWGLQMTYVGGAGLLSPGRSTRSTFLVDEPGTYLAECYVKAPDGTWHTSMGMLHEVEVVASESRGSPPEADHDVRVGSDGVEAPERVEPGRTTFRVTMLEDPQSFMPYDLNLARIDDETDLDELVFWMDWSNVGGLRAPAPVEFLGGVEHMNAVSHGTMTVDLEPGRYLWISEIDAARMHKAFEVGTAAGQEGGG
ncbi:MAG: hypothetical protein R3323_11060, partial [Wenzhouxiangellaceae bacterium]|nr:hypothetical protein [Wenzhouxiangellaceae bacterium]